MSDSGEPPAKRPRKEDDSGFLDESKESPAELSSFLGQVSSYAGAKAEYLRGNADRLDFTFCPQRDDDLIAGNAFEMGADLTLGKYWRQRFHLFSLFDKGVLMDQEGWFSVTPENVARHIARRCQKAKVIVDAFCGVGGNAIQFATFAEQVIAIDLDPVKILCARENARIYGVADRINFIGGDFLHVAPKLRADAVFLSPPWGGPDYSAAPVFDVDKMLNPSGFATFAVAAAVSANVAFFVPKNVDKDQLRQLAGQGGRVYLENARIGKKVKCITAYYGNLVDKD